MVATCAHCPKKGYLYTRMAAWSPTHKQSSCLLDDFVYHREEGNSRTLKKFTQAIRMTMFNNNQNQQYNWQKLVPVGQVLREQRHKSNKVKRWRLPDVGETPLRQCKTPFSLLYRSRRAAYLDFEERWPAGQVIHHGIQYGA